MEVDHLIAEYKLKQPTCSAFSQKLQQLIGELLTHQNLQTHSVTSRVKELESLYQKVKRPGKAYKVLFDITDIIGVRIITYFENQVKLIANIIESEFEIDIANSTDKKATMDVDRFGYLSLHYICYLKTTRSNLAEYSSFAAIPFEVQIRSILQHAWAEIEHDLGYKSKVSIPLHIRRRFARIAGLLELADEEFNGVDQTLHDYQTSVDNQISQTPSTLLIDKVSLKAYLESSSLVEEIDNQLAESVKLKLNDKSDAQDRYIEELIRLLNQSQIKSIAQLEEELIHYKADINNILTPFIKAVYTVLQIDILQEGIIPAYWSVLLLTFAKIMVNHQPPEVKIQELIELYQRPIGDNNKKYEFAAIVVNEWQSHKSS